MALAAPGTGAAGVRRFLIVMGLPKSGTTFVHAQLKAQEGHFNLPARRKEIDFFRAGEDFDTYLSQFASHEDRTYLDASPLYIDDALATSRRIAACLKDHEVRVLVCLRDVFERVYSHYLHDVAQNFQIFGHGEYSLRKPSVLAKYLYPLAGRIRHLQSVFGKANVFGFSFSGDTSAATGMIRGFAGLPPHWTFDFAENPAPGFTSPRVFFNRDSDTGITLNGRVCTLPAGHLLVANRQFSTLNPDIAPDIGDRLFRNQSQIDRVFDTALFSDAARRRIVQDQIEAGALLGVDLPGDTAPKVLASRVSGAVPDRILARLHCIDTLDAFVARLFNAPMAASEAAILACPEPGPAMSTAVARLSRAAQKTDGGRSTVEDRMQQIVTRFGPVPVHVASLVRAHLAKGRIDEIERLLKPYGSVARLLQPFEIASFVRDRNLTLSTEDRRRLAALGLKA